MSILRRGSSLLAAVVLGCGGDDPSGPKSEDIHGTWRVSYYSMTFGNFACDVDPVDYVITQFGPTFSGTSSATWAVNCSNGADAISQTFVGGTIYEGSIDGDQITFYIPEAAAILEGTMSGTSMIGTAMWLLDVGGGTRVLLYGYFSGERLQ